MDNRKGLVFVCILLMVIVWGCNVHSPKVTARPMSRTVRFSPMPGVIPLAWWQGSTIRIAIYNANPSDIPVVLGLGTMGLGPRVYQEREAVLRGKGLFSSVILSWTKTPTHFFLFVKKGKGKVPVAALPIGREGGFFMPHVVRGGDALRVFFISKPGHGHKAFFMPRSLSVGGVEVQGRPCSLLGTMNPKPLGLSQDYLRNWRELEKTHYLFVSYPDRGLVGCVEYRLPPVDKALLSRITPITYEWQPHGEMRGGGKTLNFLVLPPPGH